MEPPAPRVLCLSPFFAPLANAEAFCGGKAALSLLDAGVDLTVMAVDYHGHGKFSNDPSPLWARLQDVTIAIPPPGGRSKYLSVPLAVRFQTAEWSRWIAATVERAKELHRAKPFDVIYSRGLPNIAHVAAYWIARALRRPWIANLNDPWDLEGAHLLPQDRHLRKQTLATRNSDFWLRRVMATADVITFPCARLRDYHLRLHQPRGRCLVIPHIGHDVPPVAPATQFRLVHAGNLGSGESTRRNSTISLLRALRSFLDRRPDARETCRLILVGSEDKPTLALAKELNLDNFLSCTGRVSYEESVRHMAAATVCLLVEGNMPEGIYLPSKFADYVRARKPVIALSPLVGTIADVGPERGVFLTPVDNPAAIESAITRLYDAFSRGELASLAPDARLQDDYDSRRIGRVIRDLCKEVAAASPAS
jgi:glycosyltransferase involved in cell wall biosynthesis